jgi:hypothetical protein
MAGEGARRGLAYVQGLAGYWAEAYEMQRVADRLNRYERFTTVRVRVERQEGRGKGA